MMSEMKKKEIFRALISSKDIMGEVNHSKRKKTQFLDVTICVKRNYYLSDNIVPKIILIDSNPDNRRIDWVK